MNEASTTGRIANFLRRLVGGRKPESRPQAPTIAMRAPQEPYRRCVPPNVPDAPPFSYTEREPESADLRADPETSGPQSDHAQA